jgi:hypothetical protein
MPKSPLTEYLLEKAVVTDGSFGVFVGRLCPMHLGHQAIIESLIQTFGPTNHLVLLGSCNAPLSYRNLFPYSERIKFVRACFPNVRIAGLPDYDTDEEWFAALSDIIGLDRFSLNNVIFVGGSKEDVRFYHDRELNVCIVNRFEGLTPKISASEV